MTDHIDETNSRAENPYVGPESFRRADAKYFKGRRKETSELSALIAARRLVLLYAESGAGKTSLINAGVIPTLEERGFEVLPVARVAGVPDDEFRPANIYAYNVMARIDRSDHSNERLANLRLKDFLYCLDQEDGVFAYVGSEDGSCEGLDEVADSSAGFYEIPRRLLVIDQFEELFTTHTGAAAQETRRDFLAQIAEALKDDPDLYVLLSMRADYSHLLTRYLHLLPDGLDTQYYMSRMRHKQAQEAVELPAFEAGRPFAEGVAKELVDRLSRERSQDGDWVVGETVEPVQLQVVCYGLWQSLAGSQGEYINLEDLEGVARSRASDSRISSIEDPLGTFVESSLASFYEDALKAALATAENEGLTLTENSLRNWFSNNLITEAGTRGILSRGIEQTAGVPEPIVASLIEQHIIRSETQKGGQWIELIHDTFIDPVRRSNEASQQRLNAKMPWLVTANEWYAGGRPSNSSALLTGDALIDAREQAGDSGQQTEAVRAFLEASQNLQIAQSEDRARKSKRNMRALLGITLLVLSLALVAGWQWSKAEEQRAEAELQRQLALKKGEDLELALKDVATEKLRADDLADAWKTAADLVQAISLRDGASRLQRTEPIPALLLAVAANELDPGIADATLLVALDHASREKDNAANGFRTTHGLPLTVTTNLTDTVLHSTGLSGTLAATTPEGLMSWRISEPDRELDIIRLSDNRSLLAISVDGRWLATRDDDGNVYVDNPYETHSAGGIEWPSPPGELSHLVAAFNTDSDHLLIAGCRLGDSSETEQLSPVTGDTSDGWWWQFSGEPGEEVIIELNQLYADRGYDPLVQLYDVEGSYIDSNDDSDGSLNSRLTYRLSSSEPYLIEPSAYGESYGEYELSVYDQNGPYTLSVANLSSIGDTSREPLACTMSLVKLSPAWSKESIQFDKELTGGIVDVAFLDEASGSFILVDGNGQLHILMQGDDQQLAVRPLESPDPDQHATSVAVLALPNQVQIITAGCYKSEAGVCLRSHPGFAQRWELVDAEPTPLGAPFLNDARFESLVALEQEQAIAALTSDGTLILWDIGLTTDTTQMQKLACETAGRNLSYSDWSTHVREMQQALPFLDENGNLMSRNSATEGPPRGSLVCPDYNLDISFAQQAIEACDTRAALSWVEYASAEELARFTHDSLETTLNNLRTEYASESYRDEQRVERCWQQAATLMNRDAPGISPDINEVQGLLEMMSHWQDGSTVPTDDVTHITEALDRWPEQAVVDVFRGWVGAALESRCVLGSTGSSVDFGSDACQLRFELVGTPSRLEGRSARVSGLTGDAQPLWAFTGEAGEFVSLSLKSMTEGSMDPYIELLDSEGRVLAQDDDSGIGLLDSWLVFQLPQHDEYYVRPSSLSGSQGRYQLDYSRLAAAEWSQVAPGSLAPGETLAFNIDAQQFHQLKARLTGLTPESAVYLRLQNDEGNLLAMSSPVSPAEHGATELHHLVRAPGSFYLFAMNDGESTNYDLYISATAPRALESEGVEAIAVDGQGSWLVELEAFETLSVTATPDDTHSPPHLTLIAAETGHGVAYEQNDSERSILTFGDALPGSYVLEAGQTSGDQFELRVERKSPLALEWGQVITATGIAEEHAFWTFEAQPGDFVLIEMNRAADDLDPYMVLYDEQGRELVADDDGGPGRDSRIVRQLSAGTYYIAPSGLETTDGEYALRLTRHEPRKLTLGVDITTATGTTYWWFESEAGGVVTIDLVSRGRDFEIDPYIRLIDELGNQVAFDDNSGIGNDPQIVSFLPSAGVFYVEVEGLGDEEEAIALSLTQPETLSVGAIESASATGRVFWSFEGEAGDLVTIALDSRGSSQEIDPYLQLYDETGTELVSDHDSGQGYDPLLTAFLPSAGAFYIEVGGLGDEEETYTLSLTEQVAAELSQGDSQSATATGAAFWLFEGEASDLVTIALDSRGRENEIDPYLRLYNETGTELDFDHDSGAGLDPQLTAFLPSTGAFYIEVGGLGDEEETYTLSLTEPAVAELSSGESQLATATGTAYWSFEGEAGNLVTIALDSRGQDYEIDPYLRLLDETGTEVIFDHDSGEGFDPYLTTTLPSSGIFYIEVGGLGDQMETYEISLTLE